MGLDMYLSARKSGYGDYPKELEVFEMEYKHAEHEYDVGYWRKANAIHRWFVANLADGVDECQRIRVGINAFESLKKACEKVLKNPKKACEVLPTTSGFFFGGTDYDEYYLQDVRYTLDLCEKAISLLNEDPGWEFYYQASW